MVLNSKQGSTSQFTTYHLPVAEEKNCSECFLQSIYLKMDMDLPGR